MPCSPVLVVLALRHMLSSLLTTYFPCSNFCRKLTDKRLVILSEEHLHERNPLQSPQQSVEQGPTAILYDMVTCLCIISNVFYADYIGTIHFSKHWHKVETDDSSRITHSHLNLHVHGKPKNTTKFGALFSNL